MRRKTYDWNAQTGEKENTIDPVRLGSGEEGGHARKANSSTSGTEMSRTCYV